MFRANVVGHRGRPSGPWAMATALLALVLLSPDAVVAYGYSPSSESDWEMWPAYCRARYMVTADGPTSRYAGRVPAHDVRQWQMRLGDAWGYLHHYCQGVMLINRVLRAPGDKDLVGYMLRTAPPEMMDAMQRTSKSNPFYSKMATDLANVYRLGGDLPRAMEVMNQTIAEQPNRPDPYSLLAMILKDGGGLDKAIEVLQKGDKAVKGQSAEIHYHLGLLLLEKGETQAAREHASQAYDQGYPLPGLKKKLMAIGEWSK